MSDSPKWLFALLDLSARPCLIAGGGKVALRRARKLHAAGALVTIVAPEVHPQLHALAAEVHVRPWQASDLNGAFMVICATSDAALNATIATACRQAGILVNRADMAEEGDLQIPASGQRGPVSLAVHSGGGSAAMARQLRDQMLDSLAEEDLQLLTCAARWRGPLREQLEGPALQQALAALVGEEARQILRTGTVEALDTFCSQLLQRG